MPKRISRDGSIVEPHCFKFEEMYQYIFDWFKENENFNKTDVVRNAVEEYFTRYGGDLEAIKAKCKNLKKASSN